MVALHTTVAEGCGDPARAGWSLSPKLRGGRPLPCRRTGVGDVGGKKYSSLDLDATAAADIGDPGSGGGEEELSDDSRDGWRARAAVLALALVNISL